MNLIFFFKVIISRPQRRVIINTQGNKKNRIHEFTKKKKNIY